ncbi:MAG: flagellar basal body-associated FliL family protein [Opitutae bacterium]|nr:flagellar basal body-associated FliL family protein [Opitutae bacterium]
MAAKTETTPPIPAAAAAAAPAAAPAAKGALAAWLPVIAAVLLAPALSWAVAEFVLLPRLQKKLTAPKAGEAAEARAAAPEAKAEGGHGAKSGKEGANPASYEFQNVVVNLSGTMGTRYLKTSFIVTGADATIGTVFTTQKARLTDITLNVLSSLSLADLEEPGSKNILREKLVLAYNQALGKRVAEQVYFSDFVVQ